MRCSSREGRRRRRISWGCTSTLGASFFLRTSPSPLSQFSPSSLPSSLSLVPLTQLCREETGLPISRKRLRDSILNIIVAGRESVLPIPFSILTNLHHSTTAQGLSWTFFRLLHSPPSLLATLRAEVDSLGEVTYRNYRVPSLPPSSLRSTNFSRSRSSNSTQPGTKDFVSTPQSPRTPGPSPSLLPVLPH